MTFPNMHCQLSILALSETEWRAEDGKRDQAG